MISRGSLAGALRARQAPRRLGLAGKLFLSCAGLVCTVLAVIVAIFWYIDYRARRAEAFCRASQAAPAGVIQASPAGDSEVAGSEVCRPARPAWIFIELGGDPRNGDEFRPRLLWGPGG